jgi:hypothetical protein
VRATEPDLGEDAVPAVAHFARALALSVGEGLQVALVHSAGVNVMIFKYFALII